MDPIVLGACWYFVFLFSTTFHEAAHAFIAWLSGDPTAYYGGQVSLNPVPHVQREPIGMVLLPILTVVSIGFPLGWASAPYDTRWASLYPKRAAFMALAGPTSNFLIAIAAGFTIWLGIELGWWVPSGLSFSELVVTPTGDFSPAGMLVSMLFTMNLLLAVLNMLPLPPLDGSAVVPLFLSRQQTERYNMFVQQPIFSLIGMLVAWKVFPFVFAPILSAAVDLILW